jgi:hypothetical protein
MSDDPVNQNADVIQSARGILVLPIITELFQKEYAGLSRTLHTFSDVLDSLFFKPASDAFTEP